MSTPQTPQQIIWSGIGKPTCEITHPKKNPVKCAFCGIGQGVVRFKDVFGSGFTNQDRLSNPTSDYVCMPCWGCFRSENARQLRISSWIATQHDIVFLKRDMIADVLFCEKATPFCFYVTSSFKKIGAAKVSTNNDSRHFVLQFEEIPIVVDCNEHKPLFDVIDLFYSIPESEIEKKQPSSFFTKDEMRTGNYKFHRIREFGIEEWREKESVIRKYRGSAILELLLLVVNQAPSGREKNGGNNGKEKNTSRKSRPVREGKRPDLSNMVCDRLGQGLLFPEDEDL